MAERPDLHDPRGSREQYKATDDNFRSPVGLLAHNTPTRRPAQRAQLLAQADAALRDAAVRHGRQQRHRQASLLARAHHHAKGQGCQRAHERQQGHLRLCLDNQGLAGRGGQA